MTFDYAFVYSVTALSSIFWIFAAIRQYKSELFWYFFVLAISDPIVFSLWLWLHKFIGPGHVYPILLFFLLLSLYWSDRKNWHVRMMLLALILIHIITFSSSEKVHNVVMILFHLPILSIFLKRSIYFIAENGKANLFHLFLLLYETTIILKMLVMLTEANSSLVLFYVTSLFEILIAVFFSIFKENDSRLFINLKNV